MRVVKDPNLAVKAFLTGEIGVFPTDTVWGVGCLLENEKAIKRLYKIKRRKFKQATAVLVADLNQAKKLGEFDKEAEELAQKHWPGALTLIVPAKSNVTPLITGGRRKVGIRVPGSQLLLKILKKIGPVVATSANFADKKAPAKKDDIDSKFLTEVDFLLEGREPQEKQASTVVDITATPFRTLRQGSVKISNYK